MEDCKREAVVSGFMEPMARGDSMMMEAIKRAYGAGGAMFNKVWSMMACNGRAILDFQAGSCDEAVG